MRDGLDLNADLGERAGADGARSDAALLAVVTSANVACGAHAGNDETMRRTTAAAARAGVVVGAHPGYADRDTFGRRELGLPVDAVVAQVAEQLAVLVAIAEDEGAPVRYVKAHGALYHRLRADEELADALIRLFAAQPRITAVLGEPGSALLRRTAEHGLTAVAEGFADRGLAPDGSLLPRGEPCALLHGTDAARQAVRLARSGEIGSLCVHGDAPGAVETARAVRRALEDGGVALRAFAR